MAKKQVRPRAKTIPPKERWLHDNPAALDRVTRGLAEAGEGKTCDLGSFSRYARATRLERGGE